MVIAQEECVSLALRDGTNFTIYKNAVRSEGHWNDILDENAKAIEVPGCTPWIITPSDMTYDEDWLDLIEGKELAWNKDEGEPCPFKDTDDWKRYFMVLMGLSGSQLGTRVCIYGGTGHGKTMIATWLMAENKRLFGKECACDYYVTDAFEDKYGDCRFISIKNIQEELNMLDELAELEGKIPDKELKQKAKMSVFYNKSVAIDEAHGKVKKGIKTRLSNAFGGLNRVSRHLYNNMLYMSPKANDFDSDNVWSLRTHEISCVYGAFTPNWCGYFIKKLEPSEFVRTMELDPEEWGRYYKTTNLRGLTQGIKLKKF